MKDLHLLDTTPMAGKCLCGTSAMHISAISSGKPGIRPLCGSVVFSVNGTEESNCLAGDLNDIVE
jgi:hypothetical protein